MFLIFFGKNHLQFVLRIVKSTKLFQWVVWVLSNSQLKYINLITIYRNIKKSWFLIFWNFTLKSINFDSNFLSSQTTQQNIFVLFKILRTISFQYCPILGGLFDEQFVIKLWVIFRKFPRKHLNFRGGVGPPKNKKCEKISFNPQ